MTGPATKEKCKIQARGLSPLRCFAPDRGTVPIGMHGVRAVASTSPLHTRPRQWRHRSDCPAPSRGPDTSYPYSERTGGRDGLGSPRLRSPSPRAQSQASPRKPLGFPATSSHCRRVTGKTPHVERPRQRHAMRRIPRPAFTAHRERTRFHTAQDDPPRPVRMRPATQRFALPIRNGIARRRRTSRNVDHQIARRLALRQRRPSTCSWK